MRVAHYVIGLLVEVLGEEPEMSASGSTEKTFPWALGDPSPKTGNQRKLPFDAFWPSRNLIVEIDEDQHRKPVKFWDKPGTLTVSGVHRGEQRRIHDTRKRNAARKQGYVLLEIPWERRPVPERRSREQDLVRVTDLLREAGIIEDRD